MDEAVAGSSIDKPFDESASGADMVLAPKKPARAKGFFKAAHFEFQDRRAELTEGLDSLMKKSGLLDASRGIQDGSLVSDTGELRRSWKDGLISVDSPRTQGFTGFAERKPQVFKDVEISTSNPFATIILCSADGKPLSESGKVFVTAVGRAANDSDQVLYEQVVEMPSGFKRGLGLFLEKGKGGKVLAEPVAFSLKLKASTGSLTPLNPGMEAASAPKTFKAASGVLKVDSEGLPPSIWYLLELAQ